MVAAVRRALAIRRVGHAGTLDPFASGLLTLLTGRATRLAPYLSGLDKAYTGTLRLGARTTTDDLEGEVTAEDDGWQSVSEAHLADAMASLTGAVHQVPPDFSAKKVAGTPAHRRRRRGERVALRPVRVQVHAFTPTGRDGADVAFTAEVGSGTYIRALARDLGEALGCGAHLRSLRRDRVGPFRVEDAVPLAQVTPGTVTPAPPLDALRHLPAVELDQADAAAVRHGRPVGAAPGGNRPAALVADGLLLAVAVPEAGRWRPRVVLESA